MHFVYIDDAKIAPAGREANVISEVSNVIDPSIGGPVYFQNIQTPSFRYFFTNIFMRVKVDLRSTAAIQCLGKDSCS